MSAGRGTPRVPPFQGALPVVSRVSPSPPSTITVVGVSDALFNFSYLPFRSTPFALNQTVANYADANGVEEFFVPLGAIRGSIRGTYTGETGVGGRVGISLFWGDSGFSIATSSVVDVGSLTFPSAADPNQVIVPRYVEEMTFPNRTDDTPFIFRIPFWIPTIGDISDGSQSLESPFIPVRIGVREAQVGVTPGSSSIENVLLTVENYGQAMPASRM